VFLVIFSAEIVSGTVPERRDDKPTDRKERHHCLTTPEAEMLRDRWIRVAETNPDGGVELSNSLTDDIKYFSESSNSITPGWSLPVCIALSCSFFPIAL
jgi:hypothetical protein